MAKTITLHAIQTVSTNRANRGEDGSPKSIVMGGVTRTRFSSQAMKRAQRQQHPGDTAAVRTKKPHEMVARVLGDVSDDDLAALRDLMGELYGKYDDQGRLMTMVFLGEDEIQRFAARFTEYRSRLGDLRAAVQAATKEKDRKLAQTEYSAMLSEAASLEPQTSSEDVALYGRFLADDPAWSVEAATSYSHAISVHRAQVAADFFSAVDDVSGDVGHIGTNDVVAPTIYRVAVLDVDQLRRNLGREDVADVVQRWAEGFMSAIPTGGQHGAFARTLPEIVLIEGRAAGLPLSYANAFTEPVYPAEGETMLSRTRQRLNAYLTWQQGVVSENGK